VEFLPRKRERPTIDLSPLVDVVFLLIIFFTVSTTFREGTGLPVSLPSAGSAVELPTGPVIVAVGEDGRVEVNGTIYGDLAAASGPLEEAIRQTDSDVVVRGDRKTPYELVIQVMDLARSYGAKGLSMKTRKGQGTDTADAPEP
jgi:biopolymer transport protein ExbD